MCLTSAFILTACNSKIQKEENKQAVENNTIELSEDSTVSMEVSKEEPTEIVYEYEQELNIIDDNYRNYYEIFVYSFCDSNGDGIGDIQGVISKLDYIQEMGFNGIWLMPMFQSPTYHKYDVVDYYSIDTQYGTNEDFKQLVDACHERGIRVTIDFVINHSSSSHTWFKEACSYLKTLEDNQEPDVEACQYVDYYHFAKEQVNADYYKVPGTPWYYEGVFVSEMPDINLESELVRAEIEQIASFWLEMGIDGFRMDAALHFEENNPTFNTEVLNWLYSYCKEQNPDFYMVSEVWANAATIANYYESYTPSMFNFDVADKEGKLIKAARGGYSAEKFVANMLKNQQDYSAVYADYIDAPFIANHDMGRVSNALINNENHIKMAGGLLLTMNGSPFVYYGEEIGMASSGTKDENKRLPMIWSVTETGEMTKGPAAADKGIESAFLGVYEQMEDPTSILNYYKRALRLRNENPEIARGEIAIVEELCNGHQAVITKTYNGSTIAIAYNTSDEVLEIALDASVVSDMQIRGYLTLNGEVITLENHKLKMHPQSICILK